MSPADDDFGRSFLDFSPAPVRSADTADDDTGVDTRAYLLTGGRTGGGRADVKLETMVVTDPDAARPAQPLSPEQEAILETVRDRAMAVAEAAARVHLPLGVVQVLIGDLVHDGLLTRSRDVTSIHDDISLLERMIACVFAL